MSQDNSTLNSYLAIHTLTVIATDSTGDSDEEEAFNKPLLYKDVSSEPVVPTVSPDLAKAEFIMNPQACQPPPSPPASDKSSCSTKESKLSHMAKVIDGRLIRQNEYFIPGTGIDSDVLAAELPLYLGNDASQRPGAYEDRETGHLIQGYFVTAYRDLTTAMLVDIKADSARREQERVQHQRATSRTDCTTGRKIQHWRDGFTPPGESIYKDQTYKSPEEAVERGDFRP